VKVIQVRTSKVLGKVKRLGRRQGKRTDWKKAIVTLQEGDRIDFFEGA
jgi:large subunit ribosomal protein L23